MDPNQLAEVERLCLIVYRGTEPQNMATAEAQLTEIKSSIDFIPQCQYILDNSSSKYAQLLAVEALQNLVTKFWGSFTNENRIDMRNYILTFLTSKQLEREVLVNASRCICRITKLGWFDSLEQREIIGKIMLLIESTTYGHDYQIVALQLFIELVSEMNTPIIGKTMTQHRKTAVSFRDSGLLQAFTTSVDILSKLEQNQQQGYSNVDVMCTLSLQLSCLCLTFDFIGTNPEESQEDIGTIQVPSAWRPLIQDIKTMQMFFDIYEKSKSPNSSFCLKCLIQLSSVRRSLFTGENERNLFLNTLMNGIYKIMSTKIGLDDDKNYHEFCRLLGRLKASYQLSELVKTPHFQQWLQLAGEFTVLSFQMWSTSMNSIHYLLALWGRMVAALPYLRIEDDGQQAENLKACVLQVTNSYIQTMVIDSTQKYANGEVEENLLDEEGSLKEAMERFPVIAKLQYSTIASGLCSLWEENITSFNLRSSYTKSEKILIELRLTWLVHISASLISGISSIDSQKDRNAAGGVSDLVIDAKLSMYCFVLCHSINTELATTNGQSKVDMKLELALLYFFQQFKKAYLLDSMTSAMHGNHSSVSSNVNSIVNSFGGNSTTNPLLSLALSFANKPGSKKLTLSSGASGSATEMSMDEKLDLLSKEDEINQSNNEPANIFEAMGPALSDHTLVMNVIVDKICNNIKFWKYEDEILERTLEVFAELVSTYGSSKTLLSLDTVNFLIYNHDGNNFPFLGYDSDNKYRITFYAAMSRLMFSSTEDVDNLFDSFIEPKLQILSQLSGSTIDLREKSVKLACIGVLRDLRGIAQSAYNRRTYALLFEALYPDVFPLLINIATVNADDPIVMIALLKFLLEFVQNRTQRITFEQSSPNGILLFQETSKILCAYGSSVLKTPPITSVYHEKYKGIKAMLNTLTCALSGGYVNFGVFNLYNDRSLQNVLDVTLQIILQIPSADVLEYVKLTKAYYGTIEVFFRQHLDVLSMLDSSIFLQLVKANHEGLQSSDLQVISQCASSIDHLASYIFLNINRPKLSQTVTNIMGHLDTEPECLLQLLNTLFNSLLFSTGSNYWPLTRPILSIILVSDTCFQELKNQMISTQIPENQIKLQTEFNRLTENLSQSLEVSTRDKFTQRMTLFRSNVRGFMNL
jgi:exportin-7